VATPVEGIAAAEGATVADGDAASGCVAASFVAAEATVAGDATVVDEAASDSTALDLGQRTTGPGWRTRTVSGTACHSRGISAASGRA
jgi:hypothetical protein